MIESISRRAFLALSGAFNAAAAKPRDLRKRLDWKAPDGFRHLTGFNYQPSWGDNGVAIWLDGFSAEKYRFELSRGRELFPNFNCVRPWLSWSAYRKNPKAFIQNFRAAMKVYRDLDLLAMPVLFTRWAGVPPFDPVMPEQFLGVDLKRQFDPYLDDVVTPCRGDDGVLLWDLCNEPTHKQAANPNYLETEEGKAQSAWLQFVHDRVKRIDPGAKTTVGTVPGQGVFTPIEDRIFTPLEQICDVLCPHIYGYPEWKRLSLAGEQPPVAPYPEWLDREVRAYLGELRSRGIRKPVLSSETCWGSLDDRERARIIEDTLAVLRRHRIGFLAHALYTSPVADLHPPELGPVRSPGYMGFVRQDGSLRPYHDVFNRYRGTK